MNKTLPIIGIAGAAHAGKDTTMSMINKLTGGGVVTMRLASFKSFLAETFEFSPDQIEGRQKERPDARGIKPSYWLDVHHMLKLRGADLIRRLEPKASAKAVGWHMASLMRWFYELRHEALFHPATFTPRHVMQTFGTEFARKCFGPDVWVNLLVREARSFCQGPEERVIVVPDVRFPNEFDRLKEAGAKVWLVQNPELIQIAGSGHASERELNRIELTRYDHRINNLPSRPLEHLEAQVTQGLLKASLT